VTLLIPFACRALRISDAFSSKQEKSKKLPNSLNQMMGGCDPSLSRSKGLLWGIPAGRIEELTDMFWVCDPPRTESRLILFPARHGRIRRLSYFHALIVLG
jgi:hypothetical protein